MLPITQQHRNKLIYQERIARNAIANNHNILSVGCGGAIDIGKALDGVSSYGGTISFIDMDDDALDLARERTSAYPFMYSNRNIVRGVGREKDSYYDLVICGGLFDYLDDRVAGMLLQQLEKKLTPKGTVFLSNIAHGNPFRIQMEYMCDWELIERTESEVEALVQNSFKKPLDIKLERDSTGLAILCTATVATLN
jgi:2-polyprenyl-3-methyl-5-hydroxy-6-metoxy-1,4-benzoquinol methylase